LLLPLLTLGEPARIVNVSSQSQYPIDFDDVMLARNYTGGRAYTQSKLAQIMFTFDLARELDPARITANCLHPATYMPTTMVRQSGATPDQHRRTRSRIDPQPRGIGKARRPFRRILQRADALKGKSAGL
jgi:NAD(P)-dependent dehydrogenase (short-subunit alcohol dehydrogenase family)